MPAWLDGRCGATRHRQVLILKMSELAGWSDEELNAEYHKLLRAELKKNTQDVGIQAFLEYQGYIGQGWHTYIGV